MSWLGSYALAVGRAQYSGTAQDLRCDLQAEKVMQRSSSSLAASAAASFIAAAVIYWAITQYPSLSSPACQSTQELLQGAVAAQGREIVLLLQQSSGIHQPWLKLLLAAPASVAVKADSALHELAAWASGGQYPRNEQLRSFPAAQWPQAAFSWWTDSLDQVCPANCSRVWHWGLQATECASATSTGANSDQEIAAAGAECNSALVHA